MIKLSVIIPTFKRVSPLSRAIRSALDIGDVEVIVVPNGDDLSWRKVQNEFISDLRVQWYPISIDNVSAARNEGLKHANGTYVRFLDDDDFFYSSNCKKQLEDAIRKDVDISSGWLNIISNNKITETRKQPDITDLCAAMLSPKRVTQVGAHLFKNEVAQSVAWDVKRSNLEDAKWIIEISTQNEYCWVQCKYVVAAWVQHNSFRLSTGHDPGADTLYFFSGVLVRAADYLADEGRLSSKRKEAIADGLWSLLQKGLRYDYNFWLEISRLADSLACGRRPPSKIHKVPILRLVPPLQIEIALIPIRWAYAPIRKILDRLSINRS